MNDTREHLLTVAEVAERVGLKHQAVRRAISRGDLDAVKLCGRVRIEPAALTAWIERSRISTRTTALSTRSGTAKSSRRLRSLMGNP